MISQNKLISHTDNNINTIHNTNSHIYTNCSSSCSLRRSLLFFLLTLSFYPFYSSTFSYRLLELKLSFFELVNMMRCSRLVSVLSRSRERKNTFIHSFVIRHCNNNKINNAYAFTTNIFYNISHILF